jgi:hypothetical protein
MGSLGVSPQVSSPEQGREVDHNAGDPGLDAPAADEALIGFGIATAVRDAAIAIGGVLGLLYLFPLLGLAVSSPGWHRHPQQIAPMTAGLEIQASTGLSTTSPSAPGPASACSPPGPPPRSWPAAFCSASATRERQPEAHDGDRLVRA